MLASNAMDSSVRIWDVRPFVGNASRALNELYGAAHGFDKNLLRCSWSPDDKFIAAGSSDRIVYVWNALTGQVAHRLAGHKAPVNDVKFNPSKRYQIASGSTDKSVCLGAL